MENEEKTFTMPEEKTVVIEVVKEQTLEELLKENKNDALFDFPVDDLDF